LMCMSRGEHQRLHALGRAGNGAQQTASGDA
jgi:hypothetical protein